MYNNMDMDIKRMDFASKTRTCKACGTLCRRHSRKTRRIKDVGQSKLYPTILVVTVGVYWCDGCGKFFTTDLAHLAPRYGKYTFRAMEAAMHHLKNNDIQTTYWLLRKHSCLTIPPSTLYDIKAYMEYAKASGIEASSRNLKQWDTFLQGKKIERHNRRAISESFGDVCNAGEKQVKYDFPRRKGIIPEGALLVSGAQSHA